MKARKKSFNISIKNTVAAPHCGHRHYLPFRSAVRDVGKAMGFDASFIDELANSLPGGIVNENWPTASSNKACSLGRIGGHFLTQRPGNMGFPRHLSQHVGGFVISREVPFPIWFRSKMPACRNARSFNGIKKISKRWGCLKVDILALGMLSAIRKTLEMFIEITLIFSVFRIFPRRRRHLSDATKSRHAGCFSN